MAVLSTRSHGKPAPSFVRAPLLWRWGLARRASRNNFGATAEASATAMANPRRRSRALRYFGAGGWPVGLPETIFRATAKASATASLALASVVLALGSGRTGFPKQVSERRKLPRQPWQTRAVVRARSVSVALGAGPSGFPKQFSGRRPKHLRQLPSRPLPSF